MDVTSKPLVWLHGEVKTPPFSLSARLEIGFRLRQLQQGEILGLPHSRPMPSIDNHCHELRIRDQDKNWRILYRIDDDAVVIVEVFNKTTKTTPKNVIEICQKRLARYDRDQQE
jgi:phage-related protein